MTLALAPSFNVPSGVSSAFASKSSQRAAAPVSEGPSAGAYNTQAVNTIAQGANKSFNKSLQSGSGGFGTSARRSTGVMSSRESDVPGPGEYAPDVVPTKESARPSSAFASTTKKGEEHVRESVDVSDYDPHKSDGMAASVTKTFNKSSGGFGNRAARQIHEIKETPDPGGYNAADPRKPTMESGASSSRGRVTGAFASTTLRDPSQWGNGFLP